MNRRPFLITCALLAPALGALISPRVVLAQDGQQDSDAQAAVPAKVEKPKVTGRITFDGELPERKPLEIAAKAAEGCCPPGQEVDREDLSLVIGEDRGLLGVFVSVKVEGTEVDVPETAYELDQKGCRFLPHMLIVPKGAKVAFLNSDTTSHNVHLITVLNEPLNQTVLGGKRLERTFEEPERIKVTCDMHTWMKSWLVVTDATHWGVTDEKGNFSIEGLPAGEHEVTMWHETLGSKTTKITVGSDGTAEPIEAKMAKKKSKGRRRRR